MKNILIIILTVAILPLSSALAAQEIKPATMEKYRQLKADLEQLQQSKVGIYAKDILDRANRTLTKASEEIDAKNEKTTLEVLDMAILQLDLAKVKTEELEAAQKTAVTRSKADKLNQQLNDILAGKGDSK
ncbi:MAG TPA: hypothetical protein PK114_00815 [Smithellaceae bacterium]|nr:hypothetical protein [Smithellaceae bacterium]